MISFGALNAASNTDDSTFTVFHEVRKEEQETEALALYTAALEYKKENNFADAEKKFLAVLDSELIKQTPDGIPDGEDLSQDPALFLKYNVFKNLASIHETSGDKEKALDYYLEAAVVDESDVTLWWHIGEISIKILNIRLARYAFEKGLIYSPNHWPCLDKLITILYIIGDYSVCLSMISNALEIDESYTKGFAIRDQIFKEEPHFKKDCVHLRSLYTVDEERCEDKYLTYIEEALIIRGQRKLLAKPEEFPKLKLNKPIAYFTWLNVGESLLHLYSEITDPSQNQSLCWKVDLTKYQRSSEQQGNLPIPSPDLIAKKFTRNLTKETDKAGKRKRLTPLPAEKENEPQPKRRSTRLKQNEVVKASQEEVVKLSRSKETDVNWSDLLYSFLPASCKTAVSTDTDDSQDSQESTLSFTEKPPTSQTLWGSPEEVKKESVVVSSFLNENQKNCGCIDLIGNFLMALTDIWDTKWCSGLSTIFRCLYDKYRKHSQYPNIIGSGMDTEYLTRLCKVILIALELQLDHVTLSKSGMYLGNSPTASPFKMCSKFGKDDLSRFLSDLHYVSMLAAANSLLTDLTQLFAIRFYWLQGRYCVMKSETVPAINSLNNCMHVLQTNSYGEIHLHNCQTENVICAETIEAKIETVQQCQSLDELEEMFNEKRYADVIKALEPVIMDQQKIADVNLSPERPAQILLLQESLFLSKNYKRCLTCSEIGLGEALNSLPTADIWKTHLNILLTCLNSCLNTCVNESIVDDFLLQQLSDKFIKLIEFFMDADSLDSDQVTTLPWLLLYRIIKYNFAKEKRKDDEEGDNKSSVIYANPVLSYLRNAHDFLGRKHWCCHDNGLLLLEFVEEGLNELTPQLHPEERELLILDLEQCFYCLYGNPCKKTRSKIIQEHNDQPISLSWEKTKDLYYFYKPTGLPEPDLRANTVSFEVQNVFKKIVSVVPQKEVEVIPFEVLQQYIDGNDNLPETTKEDIEKKKTELQDLFYYLGDYHFKNKEFTKALKYYMHDVCIKPDRFQSWAAMALTRQTRLEEKINECDVKSDGLIKKHITSTLRCFKKAVAINKNRCVVLEEYGQAAYMLSSYSARKILEELQDEKKDTHLQDSCKTLQTDMLLLSQQCFSDALQAASTKEGEKWMHCYMLGKTAENLKKPVDTYLTYYQQSVEELWNSGARVWKKVPYHGAPQYSIEALELLYRIHASILKVLEYSEHIDYEVLERHLELVAKQKLYADMLEIDKIALKATADNASRLTREKTPVRTISEVSPSTSTTPVLPTSATPKAPDTGGSTSPVLFSSQGSSVGSCSRTSDDTSPIKKVDNPCSRSDIERTVRDSMDEILVKVCSGKCCVNVTRNNATLNSTILDEKPPNKTDILEICPDLPDAELDFTDEFPENLTEKVPGENTETPDKTDEFLDEDLTEEQHTLNCVEGLIEGVLQSLQLESNVLPRPKHLRRGAANENAAKRLKPLSRKKIIVRDFKDSGEEQRYTAITQRCLEAFGFCLRHFPEHFKSQYTMAHFLAYCSMFKNLQWSRELLLGPSSNIKYSIPLPSHGIFSGKKKTNLFQYLWKIPVTEIDRPGSFGTHVYKSVSLLLDVLYELDDSPLLVHVAGFLHKTPDKEKKYLRDNDRAFLAIKAFDFALDILKSRTDKISNEDDPKQLLFDVYEAYKLAQKMQLSVQSAEDYLIKVYRSVSQKENDDDFIFNRQQSLDEAIKLCQPPKPS